MMSEYWYALPMRRRRTLAGPGPEPRCCHHKRRDETSETKVLSLPSLLLATGSTGLGILSLA